MSTSFIPAEASAWSATRLTELEGRYARCGLVVEIEAGPIGIVVYGPDRAAVSTVANDSAVSARRGGDPSAEIEHIGTDDNEPTATRWVAVITFDWSKQRRAA